MSFKKKMRNFGWRLWRNHWLVAGLRLIPSCSILSHYFLNKYCLNLVYWKFKKSILYNDNIARIQLHCPIEYFVSVCCLFVKWSGRSWWKCYLRCRGCGRAGVTENDARRRILVIHICRIRRQKSHDLKLCKMLVCFKHDILNKIDNNAKHDSKANNLPPLEFQQFD